MLMKIVFVVLVVITFLLIGCAFVAGMSGHPSWGALFMTGAVIVCVFAACAAADIMEYRPRRGRW